MWKKIPIAGARTQSVARNCGKLRANGCGICVSRLEKECKEMNYARPSGAPPKEATLLVPVPEPTPEEYGPWQLAGDVGRARGQIAGEAFMWQEDGKLRCPAGASLWLSEVRQENAFTRACRLPSVPDRLPALCEAQSSAWLLEPKATGLVGSVWSAVSCPSLRLLSASLSVLVRCGGWTWQGARFVASGPPDFRRQYVEVLRLPHTLPERKPPPRPPRAVRSRHRWSWQDRFACNAGLGPPQVRISVAGVPAFLVSN
jgi:hypothetical protein